MKNARGARHSCRKGRGSTEGTRQIRKVAWRHCTTMGQTASSTTSPRILIVGLDSAGKTSLLHRVSIDAYVTTVPTIGFNLERFEAADGTLVAMLWDVGGQSRMRALWEHYYSGTQAIIFVIDASDRSRFAEAATELRRVLSSPRLDSIEFLLVLANKNDRPNASTNADIAEALALDAVTVPHAIHSCSAVTADGIDGALAQMKGAIFESKASKSQQSVCQWFSLPVFFHWFRSIHAFRVQLSSSNV